MTRGTLIERAMTRAALAPLMPPIPTGLPCRTEAERYWAHRPCFICEHYGWCSHREPGIAAAEAGSIRKPMGRAGLNGELYT
jgi:hypothetical protein